MGITTKVVFAVRMAFLVLLYGTWSFYHWDLNPGDWSEYSRMMMIVAFFMFYFVPINVTITDDKDQP